MDMQSLHNELKSPILPPRPAVVALTGGIGCGKSLARGMFEELGVPAVDADQVARAIHQDPRHPAIPEIAAALPEAISAQGVLKRGSLRMIFARDSQANFKLKAILKPYVMNEIAQWTARQCAPYVMWESALILDERIPADRIAVVDAATDARIVRIAQRSPDWSETEIRTILVIQASREVYLQQAHDVIRNDGSIDELRQQVLALHQRYLALWS